MPSGDVAQPVAHQAQRDGDVGVAVGPLEAHAAAEAVGQRRLLARGLGRVDVVGALGVGLRRQVEPVGGGPEQDVGRPAGDAALQRRAQRAVGASGVVEDEVVEEDAGSTGPRRAARRTPRGSAEVSPRATCTRRRPRSAKAAAQARTLADLPVPGGP